MKVWAQRSVYHKSAISLNLKKMASRPSRREHCFESLGGEWKNRDLRARSTSVQKMRSLPLIVRVARHFNRILRQNHPRSFKFRIEGKNFCTFIDHGGKIWQKVFLNSHMMRFQKILAKEKIKSDFNTNLKHLKKRKFKMTIFLKFSASTLFEFCWFCMDKLLFNKWTNFNYLNDLHLNREFS